MVHQGSYALPRDAQEPFNDLVVRSDPERDAASRLGVMSARC